MLTVYIVAGWDWERGLAPAAWYLAQGYTLGFCAYVLALAGLYLLRARAVAQLYAPPLGPARTEFVLLVPAHNEEALLPGLLASLAQPAYPVARYTVLVVADSCIDQTARLAQLAGVPCLERRTAQPSSKAQALRQRVGAATRQLLGLESFLFGLGCCARGVVFSRLVALPTTTLAENQDWKAYLTRHRVPVAYCPAASLRYEAVRSSPAFTRQRQRWLAGQLTAARTHGLAMLTQGLRRGRPSQLDFACELPPRSVLLVRALGFGGGAWRAAGRLGAGAGTGGAARLRGPGAAAGGCPAPAPAGAAHRRAAGNERGALGGAHSARL